MPRAKRVQGGMRASHVPAYKWGDGDWRDSAACGKASEEEQEAMTGGAGGNGHYITPAREAARKFCDNCPVRTECFNWANNEDHFMGVAAGYLFGFHAGRNYRQVAGRRLVKL